MLIHIDDITIDTDDRFRVTDMPGVAWYVTGAEIEPGECEGHPCEDAADMFPHAGIGDTFYCDGECASDEPTGMVYAVMVGDDRKHLVDPEDLIAIDEDAYCGGCGQIGCGWH